MRFKTHVVGISKTRQKFARLARKEDELDAVVENSMKRIQFGAFRRGPVDTGFLTSNLLADENRRRGNEGKSVALYELVDGTTYTLYQEFLSSYAAFFIRNSVDEERPKLEKDLRELLGKG